MWDLQRLEAAGGWQMSTQHTPKFPSCLTVVRCPVTKSLWQESKDTAKTTCQPQRETGEGDKVDHSDISDVLETLDSHTRTRS